MHLSQITPSLFASLGLSDASDQIQCGPSPVGRELLFLVDGLGADGVVDAAGVSATLKIALDVIRPNGWISKVGWGPQPVNFSLDQLVQKNVRLEGSFSHNWPMWERALRMLGTGQLDLTPVLGGTFPIEQWETAFKKMHSGEFIKSVIKPA